MEFIVPLFIIISIVTSIIGAVKKSSSKGAPQRPYFPTLSVDTPVKPQPQQPQQMPQPQQQAAGERKAVTVPDTYDPYGSTQAYDIAAPKPYETLEMADLPSTADVYVKSAELSKDIKTADADLTDLKVDLQAKDTAAPPKAVPVFDRLSLFKGRDEIVKALIYSEVMRPRFRAR